MGSDFVNVIGFERALPCELLNVVIVPALLIPVLTAKMPRDGCAGLLVKVSMRPRLFIAKLPPAEICPEFVNAVIIPVVSLNSPKSAVADDISPELVIVPIVPLFLNPLLVPAEIIPVLINDVIVEDESKLCKPNCAAADIVPEFVIVPIVPLFCMPKSANAKILPELEFINAVIVPSLSSPKSLSADIVPEFVIVPIIPMLLKP